eukprot:scpid69258/ scgid13681/ 
MLRAGLTKLLRNPNACCALPRTSGPQQASRGLHSGWKKPSGRLLTRCATLFKSQLRARHGHSGGLGRSASGGRFVLLRGVGWCCGVTAVSFGAVAILDQETSNRDVNRNSTLAMLSTLGVFALVFAASKVRHAQFAQWLERRFIISTVAFRPSQVLGSTLYHAGVLHLAANSWALLQLYRLPSSSTGGEHSQMFPAYSLAIMLSCAAWVSLARFGAYARLMSAMGEVRLVQACGASCGLMAVLGCHAWDTRKRFRVVFTDVTLSPAQLTMVLAGVDLTLLILRFLRLYATRMDHVGHLMGLGAGVLISNDRVTDVIAGYTHAVSVLWVRKVRPYVMGSSNR